MKPYTVLLLYPDYRTQDYGRETYLAWVDATDPNEAVRLAQEEAFTVNEGEPGHEDAEDFYPLAVFEGHLSNVRPDID